MDDLIFDVAPANGSSRRPIRAMWAGQEIFRDVFDPNRASERERFAERLAVLLDSPSEELKRQVHIKLPAAADAADRKAANLAAQAESTWEPSPQAKAAAERLLEKPDLLARAVQAAEALGVVAEAKLACLVYLVTTSRLLPKPGYLLVKGDPASGKSFIARRVCLELFPPTAVEDITDLTPEALYYLGTVGLRHRALLLGECRRQSQDEAIDRTRALREFAESGCLTKVLPDPKNRRAEKITVEGPAAIIETCSHDAIPHEDYTRMVVGWPDDSPEQTRRILEAAAAQEAGRWPQLSPEEQEMWQAAQYLLEPCEVRVPFLDKLAKRFPAHKLEARRAFHRVTALTKASAALHQRQRKRDPQGRLLAVEEDLRVALRLLRGWLRATLAGGVAPSVERVWAAARKQTGIFTAAELEGEVGLHRRSVGRALGQLVVAGALEYAEPPREGVAHKYRVAKTDWTPGSLDLEGAI